MRRNKLIKLLGSSNPEERIKGLQEIEREQDDDYLDDVVKCLKDEDEEVIVQALITLRSFNAASYGDALLPLKDREYSLIRSELALTLGHIGERGYQNATETLHELLADKDFFVHKNAIKALGQAGNEKSVDLLLEYANQKTVTLEVKQLINFSLGQIGGAKAWQALSEMVKEGMVESRRSAIKALGESGYTAALELLAEVLHNEEEDKSIRKYAKAAIERFLENAKERYIAFEKRVKQILSK